MARVFYGQVSSYHDASHFCSLGVLCLVLMFTELVMLLGDMGWSRRR